MKRSRFLFGLMVAVAVAVVAISATAVFAGTYRSPSKDAACDGSNCYDNFGLEVQSSGSPGGGPCSVVYYSYIGWDLTSETGTWQSASLKLTAYDITGGEAPFTFKLYPVNNDTWTEGGADPGYDESTELASVTDDLTDNEIEFKDDASNTLGTYFLNKKGSVASVALVMTDGCGTISGDVKFEDIEGTGGSAPQSANEADLIFWTGSGATAVSLSSLNANGATPNWPLYAGLAALAALVLVAAGFGIRRFNS